MNDNTRSRAQSRQKAGSNGHTNGRLNGQLPSLPHNDDIEKGLVGAILSDPDAMPAVVGIVEPTNFYVDELKIAFQAALDQHQAGNPIDPLIVAHVLQQQGGRWSKAYAVDELLSECCTKRPSTVDLAVRYAEIVGDLALRRKVIEFGSQTRDDGASCEQTADELIETMARRLEKIQARRTKPAFSLDLAGSGAFFRETFKLDWLVDGVIVADEPGIIGGPIKGLKSSILTETMVALGTGTDFLGRFRVPRPCRVALISGESGRRTIQSNARQMCASRGLDPAAANIFWGFRLPQLTSREHLNVLRKTIDDNGIEVIGLDPLYLMVLAGPGGVDTSNMFHMGPMLAEVGSLCLEEGCTPIFAHHFVNKRHDPFASPELTDLAYGGISQFVRQWMLVSHRQSYDAENGKFFLNFRYGGSAGHCGDLVVDVEVGKVDATGDSRKWVVTIATPSEEREAQQEAKKADKVQREIEKQEVRDAAAERKRGDLVAKAIDVFKREPDRRATQRRLKGVTNWSTDKATYVIDYMLREGILTSCNVPGNNGREYDGFQLTDDPEKVL